VIPGSALSLRVSPNPFNPALMIGFDLPREESVRLRVHGPDGRIVGKIASGTFGAGPHQFVWNGRTSGGLPAAPGVYLLRLETEGGVVTKKVVLLE
jgi:hypothetical protein